MAKEVLRSRDFVVVLNKPLDYWKEGYIEWDVDRLASILHLMYPFYACILHDCDIDDETGEQVIEHFHIVIRRQKMARFSTVLNELSKWTGYPTNCISVEYCQCFNKSIRYLTHMDNPEKYPYSDMDLRTNHQTMVNNANEHLVEFVDYEYLAGACYKYNGELTEIIKSVGIVTYNQYWRVIHAIINDEKFKHKMEVWKANNIIDDKELPF